MRVNKSTIFRRVRRINFPQRSRQHIALDLETLKISAPLRQVFLRLRLLQPRQHRAQTVASELSRLYRFGWVHRRADTKTAGICQRRAG
jgi:hypothetical protein